VVAVVLLVRQIQAKRFTTVLMVVLVAALHETVLLVLAIHHLQHRHKATLVEQHLVQMAAQEAAAQVQ